MLTIEVKLKMESQFKNDFRDFKKWNGGNFREAVFREKASRNGRKRA